MSRSKSRFHRKVSSKNQVAIPAILMKKMNIMPEGMVVFTETEKGILIEPMDDPIAYGRGLLKRLGGSDSRSGHEILMEMRKEQREIEQRKYRRLYEE